MRTVFSSHAEVCHLFANLTDEERFTRYARAGNIYFENGRLYSYGYHFIIATYIEGSDAVLVSTRGYSVSTGQHQAIARRALAHHRLIFVPDAGLTPSGNFSAWEQAVGQLLGRLARARKPEIYLNEIALIREQVEAYAEELKMSIPSTLAEALDLSPEAIAKAKEGERLKAEAAKREAAERLEKWRKREAYSVPGPFTYLRINRSRELVETSQGVEMGLQPQKGFIRLSGTRWPDGKTLLGISCWTGSASLRCPSLNSLSDAIASR